MLYSLKKWPFQAWNIIYGRYGVCRMAMIRHREPGRQLQLSAIRDMQQENMDVGTYRWVQLITTTNN